MNSFLTGLAATVLAVAFALLIGPRMIDWTGYRSSFEHQASDWLGREVKIEGSIGVVLLPEPVISFSDVTVAGAGQAGLPFARIGHFEAMAALVPLVTGRLSLTRLDLDHFALGLTRDAAGRDNWSDLPARIGRSGRVNISAVNLVDGTVSYRDPARARDWRLEKLSGRLTAQAAGGPFNGDLAFSSEGHAYALGGSVGARDPAGRAAATLSLSAPDLKADLGFQGDLVFSGDPGTAPGASGTLTLAWGQTKGAGGLDSRTLQATGRVSYDRDIAQVSGIDARTAGSRFGGAARLDLTSAPLFDIDLKGETLSLDGLMPKADAQAPFARWLALPAPAGLAGHLKLAFDAVLSGDGVTKNVALDATLGEGQWHIAEADAELDGAMQLGLQGALGPAGFTGQVSLHSPSSQAPARWIADVFSIGMPGADHQDSFATGAAGAPVLAQALIALGPDRLTLDDLVVAYGADPSAPGWKGSLDWQASEGLTIKADGALFDLDPFLPLLEGRSDADMAVSGHLGRVLARGEALGGVEVEASARQGDWSIRKLKIADLAGLRIEGTGAIRLDKDDMPSGAASVALKGSGLEGLARLTGWQGLVPGGAVALDLALIANGGGQLTVAGTLGGSKISARLACGDKPDGPASIKAEVSSNDAAALLRQLGFAPSPTGAGPASLDVSLTGPGEGPLKGLISFTAGAERIWLDGTAQWHEGGPQISGKLKADTANATRGLALAGVPSGVASVIGQGEEGTLDADLEYDKGAWSLANLGASWGETKASGAFSVTRSKSLPEISGVLSFNRLDFSPLLAGFQTSANETGNVEALDWSALARFTGTLDLAVADASLGDVRLSDARGHLALAGGVLTLSPYRGTWGGGRLSGEARFSDDGDAGGAGPRMTLHLDLDGADAGAISMQLFGASFGRGKAKLALDLAAQGLSKFIFLSSLNGKGRLDMTDVVFTGFDLAALGRGAAGLGDVSKLAAMETQALSSGETRADPFGGDVSVANGTMRFEAPRFGLAGGKGALSLQLDALRFRLDGEMKLFPADTGTAPPVSILVSGEPERLDRWTQTAAFDQVVSARVLQKQIEKLDPSQAAKDLKELVTPEGR
ncbi:MAG: AsmA family protein [Parvibaculaceae bacterium]|nr:AsmA family protein [Parvibaculaceae bacterium]